MSDALLPLNEPLLEGLNPQQAKAVVYRGSALLIVAGAGTGKTAVLTRRIALLLKNREAWPSQIMAITFTNKAASEMRERIVGLVGEQARAMWISTFHSACVRILRKEADRFGFPSTFTIYDTADSKSLIKRILKELDGETLGLTIGGVLGKISKLKNELIDVEEYSGLVNQNDPNDVLFLEIFRRYTNELRKANAFDFDDLIGQTVYLFKAFPEIRAMYQRRFRHILVDEYQDTNKAQYELVHQLTRAVRPEHLPPETPPVLVNRDGGIDPASVTVVGDSDQSIYAFRGADIRNILEFRDDFPGAETIVLEQNYRSTQNILDAANGVISNNFNSSKNLFSDYGDGEKIVGFTGVTQHDEARFIADEIETLHGSGTAYRDIAVFYRTNSQTRAIEEIFMRQEIPYRIIGGTKFYDRAEIKDMLAYLHAVANPDDGLAHRRIINAPKRGIGDVTASAIQQFADNNGISFREALRQSDGLGFGPKINTAITDLVNLLDQMSEKAASGAILDVLQGILETTGYQIILKDSRDPQENARAENIDELIGQIREYEASYPDGNLLDFLTEVALSSAADDLDDASGTVSLMTLHTAKGLEFEAVFISGVEEQILPHQNSLVEAGGIQEERRLFYVGITRAKKKLHLSLATSRATFGAISSSMPSRFLNEIPEQLIDWRESNRLGLTPSFQTSPTSSNRELKPKREWTGAITREVRDNSGLELVVGDHIRHGDFGNGQVIAMSGEGAKRIAEVQFETAGKKKLLVKIAPIEKL
jgi:DNA helicase-2/ATP-dependent DNA helicase PcrA